MGRPSIYSPEVADAIFLRMAAGESLRQICADPQMPSRETVRAWLIHPPDQEFFDAYTRARDAQADHYADEILEIADDSRADKKLIESADGSAIEVVDHEHIARSKLRVDARKWYAAKLAPRKYGERTFNEHSGPAGGPIRHSVTSAQVMDDLAAIFRAELSAAGGAAVLPHTGDRVVCQGADSGGRGEPGALPPGAPMAGPERPILPVDGDLPPTGSQP